MRKTRNLQGKEALALLCVAGVALGVLALAVPRLMAGALFAIAPGVHESLSPPLPDERAQTLSILATAQNILPNADVAVHQAFALYNAQDSLQEVTVLKSIVRASPLRPRQWLRLAELSLATDPQQALAAWRMSVFSSRIYPLIMADRVAVGLQLKDQMAPTDSAILDEQMRFSFVVQPSLMNQVMQRPEFARYRDYYQASLNALTEAEIAAIVRIYALH